MLIQSHLDSHDGAPGTGFAVAETQHMIPSSLVKSGSESVDEDRALGIRKHMKQS